MRCFRKRKKPKRRTTSSLKVLAAQTLKIASINGLGEDNKLETELEDEIRWEERKPPREVIGRARRKCADILHSKNVLLIIIILNIIDCLLVVGELTLDFHQVTNQLVALEDHAKDFLIKLRIHSAAYVSDIGDDVRDDQITVLFDRLLGSYIVWNASQYSGPTLASDCVPIQRDYNASTAIGHNMLSSLLSFVAATAKHPLKMEEMNHEHLDYEQMAHKLHYCSISILSFLLLETLIKIVSVGKRFLKKKMEMFDAVVVAISFTLDLVFLQGLTASNMRTFVIILSFLLPWRVLRVLNSLIVALMHQNRFHLKVLYKQKRKITKQYQEATENIQLLEKQIKVLKTLCNERGIEEWEINKALAHTIKLNAQGGLKALGTLVFKAAESFATLTVPKVTTASSTPTGSLRSLDPPERCQSLPFTLSCNGDVPHGRGGAPNGHTLLVGHDLQLEDETSSTSTKPAHVTNTRGRKPCPNGAKTSDAKTAVRVTLDDPADASVNRSAPDESVQVNGITRDDSSDGAATKSDPGTHTVDDSGSVVRFSEESSSARSAGSSPKNRGVVVGDASHHSAGCLEGHVKVKVVTANPRSAAAAENSMKKEGRDPTRAHSDPSVKGRRPPSVDDSSERSPVTRFYLSSDESADASLTTVSMEDCQELNEEDLVFTRL